MSAEERFRRWSAPALPVRADSTALEAHGELDNALVIFTSDNGFHWGERGRTSKSTPYVESVRVLFAVRWPGVVPAGAVDPRPVGHEDIVATILDAESRTTHVHPGYREGAARPEVSPIPDGSGRPGNTTAVEVMHGAGDAEAPWGGAASITASADITTRDRRSGPGTCVWDPPAESDDTRSSATAAMQPVAALTRQGR